MITGNTRNLRVLEELKRAITPEETLADKTDYTFNAYSIDGRTFASLSGLENREFKQQTPEEVTIAEFVKLLQDSTDKDSREFARTVNNLAWLHNKSKDPLKVTPLYRIAKEYTEKALSTRAGSVDRDLLLIAAVAKIKGAYRGPVSEE